VGSWGNAPSRSPQRAKSFCSNGVKGRSSLRGLEQRSIAALPQKATSYTHILSVKQHRNTRSPPKVAIELEPPLADGIKLDETLPHLRASAELFADALADGIVH